MQVVTRVLIYLARGSALSVAFPNTNLGRGSMCNSLKLAFPQHTEPDIQTIAHNFCLHPELKGDFAWADPPRDCKLPETRNTTK